mmetsp:Transcript_26602/g.41424  ORF Transcript_26602/g.41424 Transcript_26602/m.41424 type:complete len:345 (-) Transcript_26602:808-1842(-)
MLQVPRSDHTGNLRRKVGLSLHDDRVQSLRNHQELVLWGELAKILHSERLLGRFVRPSSSGPGSTTSTSGLSTTRSTGSGDTSGSSVLHVLEVVLGVGEGGGTSGTGRGTGLLSVPSSSVLADKLGVKLERDIGVGEGVDGSTSRVHIGGERRATLHGDTRVLGLQKVSPFFPSLSKVDIQRLGTKDLSVHLRKGAVGFLGGGVAHKSEALGLSLVVLHDDGRSDGTELLEFLTESSISDLIIKILDVQVGSLTHSFLQESNVICLELLLPFGSLLGTGDVDNLRLELKIVKVIDSSNSGLMGFVVEETESLRFAFRGLHQNTRGNLSVLGKEFLNFFMSGISV